MTNKLSIRFKQFAIGALVAALGASAVVIAAVVFSDFTSGTTISAAEMNAKLNALKDAVNASAASVACPANTPTRFTDNGNGTVCDSQTGLMWEKKTGTAGLAFACTDVSSCPDPHNVNNAYTWSAATPFTEPTGTLFTDFLKRINLGESVAIALNTVTQAGYTDWRIPNVFELQSILLAPSPCDTTPCIDTVFGPTGVNSFYWSSSSFASGSILAWYVSFIIGDVVIDNKDNVRRVRAVRGGR